MFGALPADAPFLRRRRPMQTTARLVTLTVVGGLASGTLVVAAALAGML
jgi:hypothetical protein